MPKWSNWSGRLSHKPDSYAIQLQSPTLQSIGPPPIKKHPSAGLRFQATRMCGNAGSRAWVGCHHCHKLSEAGQPLLWLTSVTRQSLRQYFNTIP